MTRPPGSEDPDRAEIAILPLLPFLFALLLGAGLQVPWPLRFPPESPARLVVGFTLFVAGIALALLTIRALRGAGQNPDPRQPTPSIVDTGPLRFSRNPIYAGMALILVGLGLAFGNGWILLLVIPAVVAVHYGVVLREEAYLERKFGDAYRDYRRRVRRWL